MCWLIRFGRRRRRLLNDGAEMAGVRAMLRSLDVSAAFCEEFGCGYGPSRSVLVGFCIA